MGNQIKSAAIPLAGYEYQNLIGLQLLRDWLEQPDKFSWIKFEADDSEIAPKGLDDIVASYADGRLLCWQVKFTTDAAREDLALSWRWLLRREGNKRSLIQKWQSAYLDLKDKSPADVALITNKIPDPEFARSLSGSKVSWSSVQEPYRTQLLDQMGSEASAMEFFTVFDFRHSYAGIAGLEGVLKDRFIGSVTDSAGWHTLKSETVKWAIYRKTPPPRGEITLAVLHHILATGNPTPLRQDYLIPRDYELPDEDFHERLCARIKNHRAPITVLWGSPGKGKSTYLSYVCEGFRKAGVPFIRHHYFLGPEDRSSDRLSFVAVKETLLFQIRNEHGEAVGQVQTVEKEDLVACLKACGEFYGDKELPFVVVIDGLDHVWREAGEETEGLMYLFKQLIPVPPNVVLVIGTQRVEEGLFPQPLRHAAKEEDWLPMPALSHAAVRRWLDKRATAGQFELPKELDWRSRELDSITDALFKISAGHPLHLIFSMRMIDSMGERVDAHSIEALPQCPTGDIRAYYNDLWVRLTPGGKELMHLLAGTEFPWPITGLGECFGHKEVGEELRSIWHLLHINALGIFPFHGSIYAFVRTKGGHDEVVNRLRSKVIEWLERFAPPYVRWGWLWNLKAQDGDLDPLVNGPGRAWARQAFEGGFPRTQIQEIVAKAESAAFSTNQLVRAFRLRWLWTRIANAADYQAYDFSEFFELSLLCNPNSYVLDLHGAGIETLASDEIVGVARAALTLGRHEDFDRCFDTLNRRLKYAFETGANPEGDSRKVLSALMKLVPFLEEGSVEKVFRFVNQFSERDAFLSEIVTVLGKRGELVALSKYFDVPISGHVRKGLEETIVRVAASLGTDITALSQRFGGEPLTGFWMLMHKGANSFTQAPTWDVTKLSEKYISPEGIVLLGRLFRDYFFHALCLVIESRGLTNAPEPPTLDNREWANEGLKWLQERAFVIGRALVHHALPAFGILLDAMPKPDRGDPYTVNNEYRIFVRAVTETTFDLWICLIGIHGRERQVHVDELPVCIQVEQQLFWDFINEYQGRGLRVLTAAGVKKLIQAQLAWLETNPIVYNERIGNYVQLGNVAYWHDINDLAEIACSRAAQGLVSYGWRKDMSIYEALDSIETMLKAGSSKVSEWLEKIGPAALGIKAYTDGDETSEAIAEYLNLLRRNQPSVAANRFSALMNSQEWRDADRVLRGTLADADLEDPAVRAIARTVVDPDGLEVLEKRAEREAVAAELLNEQRGLVSQLPEESGQSSATGVKELKDIKIEVAAFGVEKGTELLERLREENAYSHEGRILGAWFDHWVQNSKGPELLRQLEQYLAQEPSNRILESLADKAFDLSLKVEGPVKAYKWLVAAQIALHGWDSYFTAESKAFRRFNAVAVHYKDKWLDFIRDTSRSPYRWSRLHRVLGQRKLVQFLVAVGQIKLAEDLTEAIVELIREDVADQPLTKFVSA